MNLKTLIKNLFVGGLMLAATVTHASLNVGDVAPDWTLQGSDGQTYQLSQLRGKHVVLAFFRKRLLAAARLSVSQCATAKSRCAVLTWSSSWLASTM